MRKKEKERKKKKNNEGGSVLAGQAGMEVTGWQETVEPV